MQVTNNCKKIVSLLVRMNNHIILWADINFDVTIVEVEDQLKLAGKRVTRAASDERIIRWLNEYNIFN